MPDTRPDRTFLVFLTALLALSVMPSLHARTPEWVGSWSAAMLPSPIPANRFLSQIQSAPSLSNQTVRQTVRLSLGGERVRIRFSNVFGNRPLTIDAASVGSHVVAGSGTPSTASLHPLRFAGHARITLAAGQRVLSDPVTMPVEAGESLDISFYVAGRVNPSSWNQDALQHNRLSTRGDQTLKKAIPGATVINAVVALSGVEVESEKPSAAVVTLGDSITRGFRSTPGANASWPAQLALRLHHSSTRCRVAVLNAGIDGNQVSAYNGTYGLGQSMLQRFDRDVVGQAGVRFVILLGGINDIGENTMVARAKGGNIDGRAVAMHVIDAQRRIIQKAHQSGLKIFGATLPPFAGTTGAYSVQGERARRQINQWIRHNAGFDALIDFDALMRDPGHPGHLRRAWDSGDHLHPNDDGYRAMAKAIPLSLFNCGAEARPVATQLFTPQASE